MERKSEIERKTKETQVRVKLNLDGSGSYKVNSGIGFLNHMLDLFSKHSLVDLEVEATGDLEIEPHHLVEDVGIVLGQAVKKALGDKKGISRYGFFEVPMDEALCRTAIDFSGRGYLVFNAEFKSEMIGELPTEMIKHFFYSFADQAECNLHINLAYGENEHHKSEAIFKSFARALRNACAYDERSAGKVQSTKGVI